ncbi:MAG: HAMP domain-containing sensor histidine kinase [Alphaproteobacteria bacterium]|nr:HAMP domain-containing sensor histidine kinase [Alphaproteobacteria bacterium]
MAQAKKRTPEQLQELGNMTQGLLHNINNSLATIAGYSEFLCEDLPRNSQTHGFAEKIQHSAEHIKTMVHQLWMINGISDISPSELSDTTDLAEIIETILLDIAESVSKNLGVVLDFEVQEDLHNTKITGHQGYLTLAILGLINNAIESFLDQQKGEYALQKIEIYLGKNPENKEQLILEIKDNGTGMPEDVLEHCQKPFFSTKDPSLHHGLGLTTTKTILKTVQAKLDITSKRGHGTNIKVYFPHLTAQSSA